MAGTRVRNTCLENAGGAAREEVACRLVISMKPVLQHGMEF